MYLVIAAVVILSICPMGAKTAADAFIRISGKIMIRLQDVITKSLLQRPVNKKETDDTVQQIKVAI